MAGSKRWTWESVSRMVRVLGGIIALFLVGLSPAKADPPVASAWSVDLYSAVRLLDLGGKDERWAAVELALKPGFKTYWRYPGDSGVPPQFTWTGSQNLRSAEILWPAPIRFSDASGQSIGYSGSVSFMVRLVPEDQSKPVLARLAMDYAVCEKLCLPARGTAELSLAPSARHGQAEAMLRTVPASSLTGFDLVFKGVEEGADKPVVMVDVTTPSAFSTGDDLFAEGPSDSWALPLPMRFAQEKGVIRYRIMLDGLPRGQSWRGQTLTLTLVTPSGALEKKLTLPN